MQIYSFINSSDAFQWERNPTGFHRDRLFEHTSDFVIEEFRTKEGRFKNDVTSFPALLSVESDHDVAARVGWIEKIDWNFDQPVVTFRFDESFRPIEQGELKEIQWELGIDNFEFYRTHWALKQADLLTILRNRGFGISQPVSVPLNAPDLPTTSGTAANKSSPLSNVFISYSHIDSVYLKRLQTHLAPVKKWTKLQIWDDTLIHSGDQWKEEIEQALVDCSAAILLVSADFLASDFISENELPPLLKKAAENGARIIPIIVKPCLYTSHPELKGFQALNPPEHSLISLSEAGQEALWAKLAQTVLDMVGK